MFSATELLQWLMRHISHELLLLLIVISSLLLAFLLLIVLTNVILGIIWLYFRITYSLTYSAIFVLDALHSYNPLPLLRRFQFRISPIQRNFTPLQSKAVRQLASKAFTLNHPKIENLPKKTTQTALKIGTRSRLQVVPRTDTSSSNSTTTYASDDSYTFPQSKLRPYRYASVSLPPFEESFEQPAPKALPLDHISISSRTVTSNVTTNSSEYTSSSI